METFEPNNCIYIVHAYRLPTQLLSLLVTKLKYFVRLAQRQTKQYIHNISKS